MNSLTNPKIVYRVLAYVAKILFPSYPCYYFPSFLLLQIYNKLVELKKNPQYRVIPLPNKFYTLLTKNQTFQCDHFCFVSDATFDKYDHTDDPNFKLNWLNVDFGNGDSTPLGSSNIVQTILSPPKSSMLVPVAGVQRCNNNCIFVSENCYHNWCIKKKVRDNHPLLVRVQRFHYKQHFPRLATEATIFLVKHPHDLPFDVTDEIISNFFEKPAVVYRNHTYEIPLVEDVMSMASYSENFEVLVKLKKLYFRCVHLESNRDKFENFAVVHKGSRTLHQSTSINYPIPRQYLDDNSFVTACPWGYLKYFNQLKACIKPFIGPNFYLNPTSPSNSPSTNSAASPPSPEKPKILMHQFIKPIFLLQGDRGAGKRSLVGYVAQALGFHLLYVDCYEFGTNNPAQIETKLKAYFAKASTCDPIIIAMINFEIFGVDSEGHVDVRIKTMFEKELQSLFAKERSYPVVLVAVANGTTTKAPIQSLFLDMITIEAPDKDERFIHLQWLFHQEILKQEIYNGGHDEIGDDYTDIPLWNGRSIKAAQVNMSRYLKCYKESNEILKSIADQSHGFHFNDLKMMYNNSTTHLLALREPGEIFQMENILNPDEFDKNLSTMQSQFTDSLGAPKVPRAFWSDIGGLSKLKGEIQSSIGLPLKHAHLMGEGMRRSGILLYGPPGTGKTLVAKAVATECSLSFLSVQGPELLNMYVVFVRARAAAPCVIFLDELDSLATNRGVAGDSGGVMDRVVSQLLAEMDGMVAENDAKKLIFILAATNRPDLIDPALLRPGRFDKLLYVGPYVTKDDKMSVLKAQMKKFHLSDGLTIDKVASLMNQDMTGADIYSICSNAWMNAVRRVVTKYEADEDKDKEKPTADDIFVNLDDFRYALSKFVPSIKQSDMDYYR